MNVVGVCRGNCVVSPKSWTFTNTPRSNFPSVINLFEFKNSCSLNCSISHKSCSNTNGEIFDLANNGNAHPYSPFDLVI